MHYLKNLFSIYLPILKNKKIIKIIFLSFLVSIFLVSMIFYYLWNLAPSFSWIHIIIGEFYYDLVKIFWKFIVFSFLILLIPPLFSIIICFFLDDIIEGVYYAVSKKKNLNLKTLSFFSGIIVSLKILIYSISIFIMVVLLKFFFFSNFYLVLVIQFVLSSFIISKEYSNLICYKFSIRNPNLFTNIKNGLICNIFFSVPLLGVIAPILTSIIVSTAYIKQKDL